MEHGELISGLCDGLWVGWSGREGTRIHTTDSFPCTAETNNIVKHLHSNKKVNGKNKLHVI